MVINRKKTAALGVFGLAAALSLTAVLPGSAAPSEGGGFQVRAADWDDPKIEAITGMEGTEALPGSDSGTGALPGAGGLPDTGVIPGAQDRVLATYTCGPESFQYTQSMADLTTANLALHALGKDSEMKKGPGGWEGVGIIEKPGTFTDSGLPLTIIMVGDIDVAVGTTYYTARTGAVPVYEAHHSIPNGQSQSKIRSIDAGHNTQGVAYMETSEAECSYIKAIDGKLSSLDGSPAYYEYKAEDVILSKGDVSWSTVFAKDGQFYRDGGKPQFLRSFSDGPTGKNRIVAEFTYPSGTTIAGTYSASNPQLIEPVRAPFSATPILK